MDYLHPTMTLALRGFAPPPAKPNTVETLAKAVMYAEATTISLRAAHDGCDAITSLVLLPLIEEAAKTERRIKQLLNAINSKD